jgi:transcriptional regulator with XRE-family HTH domain
MDVLGLMLLEKQLNEYLGRQIRLQRKIQNLSIETLAEKANIHDTHLGDIERGNVNTKLTILFKISAGLNLIDPLLLLNEAKDQLYPTFIKHYYKK